jgi:hypothetical protein
VGMSFAEKTIIISSTTSKYNKVYVCLLGPKKITVIAELNLTLKLHPKTQTEKKT